MSFHEETPEQLAVSRILEKRPSATKHGFLYVSNLPHGLASSQLEEAFNQHAHAEAAGVELLKKGHGGFAKTCGLAVVSFRQPHDLDAILAATDGKVLMGRPMIVRKDRFVEDDCAYVPGANTSAKQQAGAAHTGMAHQQTGVAH